jgi:hypothetical protein
VQFDPFFFPNIDARVFPDCALPMMFVFPIQLRQILRDVTIIVAVLATTFQIAGCRVQGAGTALTNHITNLQGKKQ